MTTLEADDTRRVLVAFLRSLEFRKIDPGSALLIRRRGKDKPNPTTILTLPQVVRIEFDRGRVSVAASIQEYRKHTTQHMNLMMSIVSAMEQILVNGMSMEDALEQVTKVERVLMIEDSRRKRGRRNAIIGILLAFVAVIVLIVAAASSI